MVKGQPAHIFPADGESLTRPADTRASKMSQPNMEPVSPCTMQAQGGQQGTG